VLQLMYTIFFIVLQKVYQQTFNDNFSSIDQRFSNFDHGPLFSSGIVGGPHTLGLPPLHFRNPGRGSALSLPPLPLAIPFLPFSHSLPFPPLRSRHPPPIAARGSGGALKLPQRVRAEPGPQTHFRPKLAPF